MVERTPGSGAFILRSIRAVEDLSLLAEKRLGVGSTTSNIVESRASQVLPNSVKLVVSHVVRH
jgi:hypothetical protein